MFKATAFFLLASFVLLIQGQVLANDIGQVVIVKNKVEATRNELQIPLKRRSVVKNQDIVTTGEKARAQFRLNDDTLFTLGEHSQLEISEYLYSETTKPSAVFELTKGVFRAVTGLITKRDDPNFTVNTPVGSIGIRGTDFWGGYLDEENIDVILLSGEHPIIIENDYGRVEITEPGTGVTIKPGMAPSEPSRWSEEKLSRAVETITIN